MTGMLAGAGVAMIWARRFAPREMSLSGQNVLFFFLFIGALIALLVARKALALLEQKKAEQARWAHIREICAEHGLSREQTNHLLAIVRGLNLPHPEHAISSLRTFDSRVAKALQARLGAAQAGAIRRHLFFEAVSGVVEGGTLKAVDDKPLPGEDAVDDLSTANEPDAPLPPSRVERAEALRDLKESGAAPKDASPARDEPLPEEQADPNEGTGSLAPGTTLWVRFSSEALGCACGLLAIEREGLVVTLPKRRGVLLQPAPGAWAECYFFQGATCCFFRSRVLEISYSHLPVCRLAHKASMQTMGMREFAQAALAESVQFRCISPKAMRGDLTATAGGGVAVREDIRQGVLVDLRPGGCALLTVEMTPPLTEGALLRFALPFFDEERPEEVLGRIERIARAGETKGRARYRIDVDLAGLDQSVMDRLVRAAFRLRRKAPSSDAD